MTAADLAMLLKRSIEQAEKLAKWTNRSLHLVKDVGLRTPLSPEDLDAFEALTGRFARLSDLLMKRVFRLLDAVELEDEGTLLDALNRAEKRGVISSAGRFREIRELRNAIAHEYAEEDLLPLFRLVREASPELIEAVRQTANYAERLFRPSGGYGQP